MWVGGVAFFLCVLLCRWGYQLMGVWGEREERGGERWVGEGLGLEGDVDVSLSSSNSEAFGEGGWWRSGIPRGRRGRRDRTWGRSLAFFWCLGKGERRGLNVERGRMRSRGGLLLLGTHYNVVVIAWLPQLGTGEKIEGKLQLDWKWRTGNTIDITEKIPCPNRHPHCTSSWLREECCKKYTYSYRRSFSIPGNPRKIRGWAQLKECALRNNISKFWRSCKMTEEAGGYLR